MLEGLRVGWSAQEIIRFFNYSNSFVYRLKKYYEETKDQGTFIADQNPQEKGCPKSTIYNAIHKYLDM